MAVTTKKDVRRGIKIYIDGSEVVANSSSIRAEMKMIRESMKHMTLGSDEYREATKKWASLNTILKEHEQGLRQIDKTQQSLGSRIKGFFNMCTAKLTALAGVLYSVMNIFGKFYDQFSQKQDTAANLKALTGLDDNSIEWLTQQAEQLSTKMDETGLRIRSSSKEILDAYMMVGSAKPELLKDKEALNAVTIEALRLSEAAKMDVKDAVGAVTTSLNQFGAGADQAARYVNVLAAGSKEGAANVTEQAAAVVKAGVAANGANVSFEQLVGCIEMLGEKGIKAEVAGTGLKKFFLTLQTGAKETNPAVVGLDQALQTLADKQMSAEHIKKMFGEEGFNVAKILMDNTEKVRQYTDAVTDTNVATEQAAINSDTTAARLAQLGNQWNELGMQLIGAFIPALEASVSVTSRLIDGGRVLLSFIKEHYVEIGILAVAYNALTIKTVVATTAQKAWTLAVTVGHGIVRAYHATLLLLQAGWLFVTQGTQAATVAMRAFNIASKGTGIGVLVAVVATAAVAIYELTQRTKEATDASRILEKVNKTASDRFADEAGKVDMLNKIIHDNTAKLADRKAALDELHKIVPGYLGELDEEGRLVRDNKQAIDDYLVSLEKQIKLKAAQEELEEQYRNKRKQEKAVRDAEEARSNASRAAAAAQSSAMSQSSGLSTSGTRALNTGLNVSVQNAESRLRQAEEVLAEANDDLAKTLGNISALEDELRHSDVAITPTNPPTDDTDSPTKSGTTDPAKQAMEAIEAEHLRRMNELRQQYADGIIATQTELNERLEALELDTLRQKLAVAGLEPKQREDIVAKVLELKMKLIDQVKAIGTLETETEEQRLANSLAQNQKAYDERLSMLRRALQAEVLTQEEYNAKLRLIRQQKDTDDQKARADAAKKVLDEQRKTLASAELLLRESVANRQLTEAEANQQRHELRNAFFQQALQITGLGEAELTELTREQAEERITQAEEDSKREEEINKRKFDAMKQVATDFGDALGDLLTDSESTFKDFMKAILKSVIDAIANMATAYIAEVTMKNIATLGPLGLAKAAGEIALIQAAKATLNGLMNFDTGGFTGDGRWDEPRGIVHAGEFVANRYAVANAAVRPVLDLLDQAQRAGTIRHLTADDIAAVAGHTASPATTTARKSATLSPISATDPETKRLLRECIATMRLVKERFDLPIVAETYATGRGGVNEAQKLVERMNANASRYGKTGN